MSKRDESGNITHQVPFDFDSTRGAWLIDYVIARDHGASERAARDIQAQLNQRTPYNNARAAESITVDMGSNILDVIRSHHGHDFIIRDHDTQLSMKSTDS